MTKQNKQDKKIEDKNAQNEKLTEMEANWKRALADYKNLEKRVAEEKLYITDFANSVLIEKLLPVLDNFELVAQHSEDMGLKLSIKELKQVLVSSGLEEIEVKENDEFDPEIMDAVEVKDDSSNEGNRHVCSILRRGYKFKGKLIRPTSVVVS